MQTTRQIIACFGVLFAVSLGVASPPGITPARVQKLASVVKAFPTADGFGADSLGGRGGKIIEVTNLNDSGDGSLRSCMEASGSRICIFRVSGTITLKNAISVSSPYLTVAGQTSPGGVQIKGTQKQEGDWGVWFVNGAHDIIVRHLRVRMGGNMQHDAGNNILFYGTAEPGVHDVIVDHCSVCWGSDTQLDWYGSYLDRATFQWNIIAEADMGSHIGGNRAPKNITLHHNLYANLGSRTPLMQHADVFDFRNNVIYNWNGNNSAVFGQFALNSSAFGNVVDNLWLAGPESGYPYLNVGNGGPVRIDGSAAEEGGTKLYISGNWGPRCLVGCTNDWTGHGVNTWDYYELNKDGSTHVVDPAQYDAEKPLAAPPVALDPLSRLLDKMLPAVGAYKPSRDAIDRRIVKSVRDRTGTHRVNAGGPWPDLAAGAPRPPLDSDHDGMPDAWEKTHGLDPNNNGDGAALAANGYTNVENVFEALDTPGQWYLDRPRGVLYYLPRPGEEMPSAEIIAPRLPQVVRVVGRAEIPVHDLYFEGLIFAHTEWQPPADYASSLQAGIEVPGALLFDYAERCAITAGGIEHIGNYGVEVGVGCADIGIARNRIVDIGAGGIRIGHFFSWETDGSGQLTERGRRRKAAMPQGPHSRRITVADNEIAHGGRFTPEAVGVFVGDNADNKVIHNHIYDLFYSGISVGSVQDFGPGQARGNIIEYNHVHDIGLGMLSDLAGIYTCSTPDSRIAYNIVHDIARRDYGGWGIYTDEGSHDTLIEKNLVYRCQDGALFAHHNHNITVENNILALNHSAQIERGGIGGFELTCRRNLIYYLEGKAVGDYGSAHCGRDVCAFDRNLYWNASGESVLFANKNFSEWQGVGQDGDSLIADPLFVDPEQGDFRLRPGSPAAQIGFEPWDTSDVGPRPPATMPKYNLRSADEPSALNVVSPD